MKFLLLTLFVAAVAAVPIPDEEEPSSIVETIVNGVPEGEALEIGHLVDINVKEHANGEVVAASNPLHPYTAVGMAEAALAVDLAARAEPEVSVPESVVLPAPAAPEVVIPESVVLPAPAAPEVVLPEPVVLPAPAAPEVALPEPVVLPAPAAPEVVLPEPVVLPAPAAPEVAIPEPIVLPAPAAPEVVMPTPVEVVEEAPTPAAQFPQGDVYNDGIVQVQVNGPEEPGMLSTLQSWLNMVINYFSDGAQTSHQIV